MFSRLTRIFAALCSGIVLSLFPTLISAQQPTAREVIAAIQSHVGVPWQSETVDTFKAGNPDTHVTGIAVTMMATMDVLQRAAAQNLNLIITHEPTFYNHLDTPEGLPDTDPVWTEKRDFIQKHNLVVWRFHDHWHMRHPDGILEGTVKALGWQKYQNAEEPHRFVLPETTLQNLASEVAQRLNSATVRVVGSPTMKVSQVVLSPGAAGFQHEMTAFRDPAIQVLVLGETREWETVEYVDDAVAQGKSKALIVIGHIPSEQAGMEECTQWLKSFVTGVPIHFVPTKQAFWSPAVVK